MTAGNGLHSSDAWVIGVKWIQHPALEALWDDDSYSPQQTIIFCAKFCLLVKEDL